jgi:hypothetical protein
MNKFDLKSFAICLAGTVAGITMWNDHWAFAVITCVAGLGVILNIIKPFTKAKWL